ncbi:MAG: tetratricopeptide repeat protein, partial [Synechococcus sp.]|nr:tetratricopeptide repeat protein [Synechococcus sp.]
MLALATLLALDLGGAPWAALAQGGDGGGKPSGRTPTAQAPVGQANEIPAEVQGWVDAALEAYQKGKPAEALRLQLQVMEWVKAHLGPVHPYRARILNNLGIFLSAVGRRQEALAPTEEAVRIYRELAKTNPAYLGDLA